MEKRSSAPKQIKKVQFDCLIACFYGIFSFGIQHGGYASLWTAD
jgi:hypothetical protein